MEKEIYFSQVYLEELLKKKKMHEYVTDNDYKIQDLFIDLLKNETIYDYEKFNKYIICCLFDYVPAIRDSEDSWNNTYYAFKSNTAFEDLSNKFSSLELRLKIMRYILKNINAIWSDKYERIFIENECCRIINKTLNELEQAKYDYMPRPDFKKLLDDPNFLKEKTPSRRWREAHPDEQFPAPLLGNNHSIEDDISSTNTPVQEAVEVLEPSYDIQLSAVNSQPSAAALYPFMKCKDNTEEVIGLLRRYMDGKNRNKPKDIMMPVRAALDARVIRKPTYTEFKAAFPEFVPRAKSSFDGYLKIEKFENQHPYYGVGAFLDMVSEFKQLKKESGIG